MRYRSVEKEAFFKAFFLFFSSLAILMGALFYGFYLKEKSALDDRLFSQMRLCSFDLECPKFGIGFADAQSRDLYTLKRDEKALYAYFPVPGSRNYVMKIFYPMERYRAEVAQIRKRLLGEALFVYLLLGALSALFSLYALTPLRRALRLTEEFVKDILHDFNTPLSVIRLNAGMLLKRYPEEKRAERIGQGVETLMRLQANLKSYLGGHERQRERFRLDRLVEERTGLLEKSFEDVTFERSLQPLEVETNKDAMERVLDNLLSNGAKYNVKGGRVRVSIESGEARLSIEDTGVGIAHPEKAFERFYKEQERGLGIGLHIVKKLCDQMGVAIRLESRKGRGTRVTLDLGRIVAR
ncbi:sensor histidine kinase [Hydrogenimonas sp.]